MYDITPIINSVILVLFAIVAYVLIPYIRSKTTANQQAIIATIVSTAVFGYEQIIKGTGMGAEKFAKAMAEIKTKLAKKSITFNEDDIKLQIEAEVRKLNISQGK